MPELNLHNPELISNRQPALLPNGIASKALAEFVRTIPISFARRHLILAIEPAILLMGTEASLAQVDVIGRLLGVQLMPQVVEKQAVLEAINRAYQQASGQAQAMIDTFDRREVLEEFQRLAGADDLLDSASRAPVIKLVNLILFEAAQSDASDVHIQPADSSVIIRTRIDGLLYDTFELPKRLQEEVISRIKVMAGLNIAEKRLPQDGRTTVQVGDKLIDLRIATLPTHFGERLVIRLLDKSARLYELDELGLDDQSFEKFRRLLAMDHGLVLVTGPTGSGKSTTLYAALRQINAKEKNILTLEDPIEYQLEGISQTQVSEKKGMTFASGLRSVLRQDPDVVMVGEVRDSETARMAIQSSLTGHLVFSTLHTNDAASAVARLLDLGIEPYLVASSLTSVLAQRLVRQVCRNCAAAYRPGNAELLEMNVTFDQTGQMRLGTGCEACRMTGYKGRVGLFEHLLIDEPIRKLIMARATAAEIQTAASRAGTRRLRDDGIRKVLTGQTTLSEVRRVAGEFGDETELA